MDLYPILKPNYQYQLILLQNEGYDLGYWRGVAALERANWWLLPLQRSGLPIRQIGAQSQGCQIGEYLHQIRLRGFVYSGKIELNQDFFGS
jgi:hypothetical protein